MLAERFQQAGYEVELLLGSGARFRIPIAKYFHTNEDLEKLLLEACLEAGCHYADISDDRGYTALVRSFGERFAKGGLAAVLQWAEKHIHQPLTVEELARKAMMSSRTFCATF